MARLLRSRASFVLFLVFGSACHTKRVAVPNAPPPAPAESAPSPAAKPEPVVSEAPAPTITTHPEEPTPYQVNKPAPPPPAAKKPTRATAAPAPAPAPAPPVSAVPAAPPPKLGDVLTADEQKQYSASTDQSLAHAQASLNAIGGRQLNRDQQAEVEQIRNFMQQAQAARSSDPSGAKSLAERAEVLARDLAATFH